MFINLKEARNALGMQNTQSDIIGSQTYKTKGNSKDQFIPNLCLTNQATRTKRDQMIVKGRTAK